MERAFSRSCDGPRGPGVSLGRDGRRRLNVGVGGGLRQRTGEVVHHLPRRGPDEVLLRRLVRLGHHPELAAVGRPVPARALDGVPLPAGRLGAPSLQWPGDP